MERNSTLKRPKYRREAIGGLKNVCSKLLAACNSIPIREVFIGS